MECVKCKDHIGEIVYYIRIADNKEYEEFAVHKECGEAIKKECIENCKDMKLEKTLGYLQLL
ncbi:hypothetical protein CTI30_18480 [Bacillus velezensis]|nr:hypothetical protein BUE72_17295 [Bacillus amyloliquefaciens]MVZ95560.1 hypothetical protein [Bacillus velezensis]PQB09351.1 hypothetical protein C5O26_21495 [Bacillus velezensis]